MRVSNAFALNHLASPTACNTITGRSCRVDIDNAAGNPFQPLGDVAFGMAESEAATRGPRRRMRPAVPIMDDGDSTGGFLIPVPAR
ncbi:hypothetical protein AWC31_10230 [Mycolicibacterium wolinskyi]|uniref:Uncharacterized protein n=1 Tax=Mycolicibacterium wolinskyi TaxID=59750 RepID=A0A1X2ERQ8_9MYCO|nr:hypothetical protein AWC31_10230 [Mycolicibacterium wolinskyi]